MPLPNIVTPEFTTNLPSTKQPIKFRPFLVKEEKVLLMAQEGKDKDEIQRAVVNVLQNCIQDEIDVSSLPLFDIEWLFLQLRAKSVGEVIEVSFRHSEKEDCNHKNDVEINVEDIKVTYNEKHSNNIPLDKGIGITMYYPSLAAASRFNKEEFTVEDVFQMIRDSVQSVYDENQVYNDFTEEELTKFLDNLNQSHMKKFMDFFETMPKIKHQVKLKCGKCGEELEYNLEGLLDFFM